MGESQSQNPQMCHGQVSPIVNPKLGEWSSQMCNTCGGFLKWGYPNSWMVFVREILTKIDDLGVPLF